MCTVPHPECKSLARAATLINARHKRGMQKILNTIKRGIDPAYTIIVCGDGVDTDKTNSVYGIKWNHVPTGSIRPLKPDLLLVTTREGQTLVTWIELTFTADYTIIKEEALFNTLRWKELETAHRTGKATTCPYSLWDKEGLLVPNPVPGTFPTWAKDPPRYSPRARYFTRTASTRAAIVAAKDTKVDLLVLEIGARGYVSTRSAQDLKARLRPLLGNHCISHKHVLEDLVTVAQRTCVDICMAWQA